MKRTSYAAKRELRARQDLERAQLALLIARSPAERHLQMRRIERLKAAMKHDPSRGS